MGSVNPYAAEATRQILTGVVTEGREQSALSGLKDDKHTVKKSWQGKLKADSDQHRRLVPVRMQPTKRAGETLEGPTVIADFRRHSQRPHVNGNSGAQNDPVVVPVVELENIVNRQVAEGNASFDIGLDGASEKALFG